MSTAVDVSRECAFPSTIDATEILDRLEIQFLDVNESRAIVIFAGGILNLECREGELTALERAEITVYDLPVNGGYETDDETAAAARLIDDFSAQLADTARSTADEN